MSIVHYAIYSIVSKNGKMKYLLYFLLSLILISCYKANEITSEICSVNYTCNNQEWDSILKAYTTDSIKDLALINQLNSFQNKPFKTDILYFKSNPEELIGISKDRYSIRYVYNSQISNQILDGLSQKLSEIERLRIELRVKKMITDLGCKENVSQQETKSKMDWAIIWTIISATIAFLAFCFGVYQYVKNRKISKKLFELNSARFYAQLVLVPFDINNPKFQIKYLLHNFGGSPAENLKASFYIIPSDFSFHNKADITSATEIPPKMSLSNTGELGNYTLVQNQIPVYFYISISYTDKIQDKELFQELYFVWHGIKNGNYDTMIELLQSSDIESVQKYINEKIK